MIVALLLFTLFSINTPIHNCKCKDIPLYGRVKVVESHADFLVMIVENHADFEVKKVTYHPKSCGEWRFVDSHPAFTIQFVDSHEDFKIKYK